MAKSILGGGTGSGFVIESASYTGHPDASGILAFGANHFLHPYFRPADGSQPAAVVLTTGAALLAADPQNSALNSGQSNGLAGVPSFFGFTGGPHMDMSMLAMRLRATRNGAFSLKLVFASEVRLTASATTAQS